MCKKIIIVIMTIIILCGCSNSKNIINNLEDLEGKNIGIYTGSEYDSIATSNIKDVKILYYNNYNDEIISLKSGKIDGFLTDEPLAREMIKNVNGLEILKDKITEDSYAFAINPKLKNLKLDVDQILESMEDDGTLEKLKNKWFNEDENNRVLEKYSYKENGKITFATVSGSAPFAYMKNNEIVGYDIDVVNYIGYKLNKRVEIVEMSFEGILSALVSGKIDMAGCSIIVTEERSKKVLFSKPNYTGGIVVVIRSKNE